MSHCDFSNRQNLFQSLNQSKCLGFFFLVWKSFLLLNIPSVDLEIMLKLIHKAEDVAKLLKEKTNLSYDITVHKQEQTDEIKQSIGKLSSLVGALQIHEMMIDSNLVIKKKNLPTDPFYKAVMINQTRRPVTNDLEFDDA